MSLYDYRRSKEMIMNGYSFYAMIMGAMRKADDSNLSKLKDAFPYIHEELTERYNAPDGLLGHEE